MAPLVHMVFRQSRTLRDVIVTSCMLDLAQEDVSTALDLAAARIESLLRSAVARARARLLGLGPRWSHWSRPTHMLLWSRRRVQRLLPALVLVAWFALPMTAVAGACVALVSIELRRAGP